MDAAKEAGSGSQATRLHQAPGAAKEGKALGAEPEEEQLAPVQFERYSVPRQTGEQEPTSLKR